MIQNPIQSTNVGSRNMVFRLGIVTAVLFTATLPARATVEFYDGTFNLDDWQTADYYWGNGGSITLTQINSGGNPGQFLEIDHFLQSGATNSVVYGLHTRNGATYTPSVQGEITAVDFSINYQNLQTTGMGQGFAFALRQDGNIYHVFQSLSGTVPGWQQDMHLGLQETSFGLMTPIETTFIIDFNYHPDFSPTGSQIEFGLATWNASGSTSLTEIVGYDNWTVTVIPEPATFAILALGSLILKTRKKHK